MPLSSVFMNTPTHTMASTTYRPSHESSLAAASALWRDGPRVTTAEEMLLIETPGTSID